MSRTDQEEAPAGWIGCSIGAVTRPISKIDPKKHGDRTISYVDISSIDNERHVISEPKQYRLAEAPSRARQMIEAGDVLFATVRPYLRNIAPVPEALHGQVASTGFAVLRPASGIDPKFLFYKAISGEFVNALSGAQYGVSYPAVRDDQVRDQRALFPPTAEQRRIVEKIEELFSELDNGVENLQRAREQLQAYRQALLKHAFEGKLTARWREEHRAELETPDQLFARIKQERERHYGQALEDWNAQVSRWEKAGKPGRKPPKPRAPKIPTKLDPKGLADLPGSWVWDRLGWMTCGVEYGTSAKSRESGRVPVLRMGNIQGGSLDWSDLAYSSDVEEIDKYRLQERDVLFNRTNSPELVGKSAIFRGDREAIFAGYLIRVNQIAVVMDAAYLNYFLNSYVAKRHGNRVKTDGVNQSNINGQKLMGYPFPYCSLAEQREVVRILEEKLSVVDQVDSDLSRRLEQSGALRQSILKKAFVGRLVPQDPADEPASVLLKRIMAEREAGSNSNKKRKTGT